VRSSPLDALPAGLRFVTVQSPNLAGRGDLAIFEPPDVDPGITDVPLVVLLHGVYGSFWNWALNGRAHEILSELIASGDVGPTVLAMPSDGLAGEGTAYLDHGEVDYERWVLDDVVACVVEASTRVTGASPLSIAGNSMGGFGALRLAAHHPSRVTAAAALSPIVDLDDLAAFTVVDVGTSIGCPEAERSLATVIAAHADEFPPIMFDCGTHDPLLESNRRLHDALERSRVPHHYEEYEGGHDWDSWQRRVGVALRFLDRAARARR
jgi:enterochelin esterase-like enzyme